ncbi:cytosine permease [Acetobacter cibinongensis]|uniref:Cytosine permease n=2 Tax=Acetobacter cibinongensis TaxID=146475 RepID=A0A0D6N4I7_9PROT|nr:cytosine permease [Acetobacter cibinongensis]GAN60483.1 cytosine/purines uracil thiamine allantoin permease [Acetobacter cibinongensis]GBQ18410.1 cytosine/purines/uracil/thiamine/allantoin transporter [Acetobacter cibinongensis NRIC 0482]GEL58187.1 cytosine permease [Acetobacter cibinongensis]
MSLQTPPMPQSPPRRLMEDLSEASVREPVPDHLKTMRVDSVFWSHFSPNLGPGGWVTGALLISMGLDFRTGVMAIVLGNIIGALPVALAASIGPATGLTQMEASRRALGRLGVRPPAFLNWIYCVGWDAVNNVPAATALIALLLMAGLSTPFWLALGCLALVQMAASIYGHHVVQILQKYLGALLLGTFVLMGSVQLAQGASIVSAHHPVRWQTFLLATGVLVSFNLSWASYSSDYTRYLPARTNPVKVVLLALAGLLGSAIPFQILGLLTASTVAEPSPTAVIASLQHAMGPVGAVALAAIALSSITGNAFNDNTASYSLISAGLRIPRVMAAILTAALGYVLAVAGAGRYTALYTDYLLVTMYWIAPWVGIVLADWYCGDRKVHAVPPGWTYGATIFVVTASLTIALFSTSTLYTGPVARWLNGADIGYYVGFFVAAGWYVLGMRTRASS